MKVQEVILRALGKRIAWWQAAEVLGIPTASMRHWKRRYEDYGCDGLYDRRRGQSSPKRVPMAVAEKVLSRALPREGTSISACGTFTRSCGKGRGGAGLPGSSWRRKGRGW